MRYLIGLLSCVFLLSMLAYAQETSTDDATVGLPGKGIPARSVLSPNASVPNKISYQGLLTTTGGAPVADGAYELKFELFNVSGGGGALWSETQPGIIVYKGTFSVLLGAVTPLTGIFYQPLWVEVTAVSGPGIAAPIVFTPRTEMASAAYALGPFLKSGDNYYLNSGSLGIGQQPAYPFKLDMITDESFVRAKSTAGWAGFIADKSNAAYNNYFILRTNGLDKWTLGTVGSNNFALGYWTGGYKSYLYVDTLGKVGVGTTTPDKLLEVAGPLHVDDTLFIGSSAQTGILNLYQSGTTQPTLYVGPYGSEGTQLLLREEGGETYFYATPDGNGTGGFLSINRTTAATGFEVNGNYGGTLNPRVSVVGASRSAIFNMATTANNSVVLPDSSISAAEMFNEPGIAAEFGTLMWNLANVTSNQRVDSITINVPAAGKVIVEANGYVIVNHTTGTNDNVGLHVMTDPAGDVFQNGCSRVYVHAALPTASDYTYNFGCRNIFNVTSSTSLKIYLIVRQASGAAISSTWVMRSAIFATYYPTTYGNTPVVLSSMQQQGVVEGSAEDNSTINVIYQSPEEFNAVNKDNDKLEQDNKQDQVDGINEQPDKMQNQPDNR